VKLAKEPAHLQGVGEAVQLGEGLDVGDVDLEPRAADVDGDHRGGGAVKAQFNRMDAAAHRRAQQAPGIVRHLGKAGKTGPVRRSVSPARVGTLRGARMVMHFWPDSTSPV